MILPTLNETATSRTMVSTFRGYNHNLRIADSQLYDMKNLTSDYYPVLSPRAKRTEDVVISNPQGFLAKDALFYVDGADLYHNGVKVPGAVLSTDSAMLPKTLISMGAYLIVFPDNIRVNTTDLTVDYLDATFTSTSADSLSLSTCTRDGASLTGVAISNTEPQNPSNGDCWLDTGGDTSILRQWSATSQMWTQVPTTYLKLYAPGIGNAGFKENDAVTVSGMPGAAAKYNGIQLLQHVALDYVVITGILDNVVTFSSETGFTSLKIERKVPKLDFYTESENRIWGCHYGLSNGQYVNEIRACALGDPTNWNRYRGISTDSYTVSLGTDGQFTGAVTYAGYPIFFKEDYIHKIYGTLPSNYQVQTDSGNAVTKIIQLPALNFTDNDIAELVLTVYDCLESVVINKNVPGKKVLLHFATGGRSIGIGAYNHTDDTIAFGYDIYINTKKLESFICETGIVPVTSPCLAYFLGGCGSGGTLRARTEGAAGDYESIGNITWRYEKYSNNKVELWGKLPEFSVKFLSTNTRGYMNLYAGVPSSLIEPSAQTGEYISLDGSCDSLALLTKGNETGRNGGYFDFLLSEGGGSSQAVWNFAKNFNPVFHVIYLPPLT